MDFIEAFSCLVQDELDRRRSRLLERRYAHSGLPERKDSKDFDWGYNTRLPERAVLELGSSQFIEAREDALLIGPPALARATGRRPSPSPPCNAATGCSTAKRTS